MTPDSSRALVSTRLPSINALIAFESVARLGAFSRAAEELSLTPSAISHRITQLESQLGAKLLLRLGQLVMPTREGEEYLGHVRAALASLYAGADCLVPSTRTTVRLSVAPAMASNWLIGRLAGFHRAHPGIDLDLIVTSRYVDLLGGEADVGIRYGSGKWPGLRTETLVGAEVVAVASPSYRKALGGLATAAELAGATLLRQRVLSWRAWFADAGLNVPEPTEGPMFGEVSLLIDAATFSQGAALVPRELAQRHLDDGRLALVGAHAQTNGRAYHLVYADNALANPAVKSLVTWLRRTAEESASGE